MPYISKHWRGEFSLAVSFWVNVFLINTVIQTFEFLLPAASLIENPVLASQVALAYLFFTIAMVYPWQIIGLWRSATRTVREKNKRLWPGVVKVIAVLGMLGTLGNLMDSWPAYKELYHIGFEDDQYNNYQVELTSDRALIHLQGTLGFGVSKDVKQLLDNNPDVRGIILDSRGGRVYEGRELSKLILSNGLDTYTLNGCYSACGIAFISGHQRYLASGANLAFHQYNSGAEGLESYIDVSSEQQIDVQLYQRRGVSQDFIDKMFMAATDDLWFPTVDEMLAAGVIHKVVNPSTLKPVQYTAFDASDLEDALKPLSAFRTIKKYQPQTYRQIIHDMQAQMKKGADVLEVQEMIGEYIKNISNTALPITSDEALIVFARETIYLLGKLEHKEPILCMKNLFPEKYGALNISQYLSEKDMLPMMDALNQVIVDSYEGASYAKTNIAAAQALLSRAVDDLGEDANYLDAQELNNQEEYSKACNAIISFYELIMDNNKRAAANALRYAFSP